MNGFLAAALGALLGAAPPSASAEAPIAATGPLRLELPIVDLPYSATQGYRAPSMAPSGAIAR